MKGRKRIVDPDPFFIRSRHENVFFGVRFALNRFLGRYAPQKTKRNKLRDQHRIFQSFDLTEIGTRSSESFLSVISSVYFYS